MTTSESQVASAQPTKVKRQRAGNASSPIRIKVQTKAKLDALLKRINKNHAGRKVKPDDLICFALDLLNEDHLKVICDGVLTNKDRLEILYRKMVKTNRNFTKDEFIGLLLEQKLSEVSVPNNC